jgi:hypothetical protein
MEIQRAIGIAGLGPKWTNAVKFTKPGRDFNDNNMNWKMCAGWKRPSRCGRKASNITKRGLHARSDA